MDACSIESLLLYSHSIVIYANYTKPTGGVEDRIARTSVCTYTLFLFYPAPLEDPSASVESLGSERLSLAGGFCSSKPMQYAYPGLLQGPG